jgi:uncharacterized protein (DUF427 family)
METQTTRTTGRAVQVRVEQGAKRVRAYLGGGVMADTTRPRLVWKVPYYPAYYFLVEDVGPTCWSRRPPSAMPEPRGRLALHDQGGRSDRRGRSPTVRRLPDRRGSVTS